MNQDGDPISASPIVNTIAAQEDNFFDASQSSDPRGGSLDYHWVINTPLKNVYASRGIIGYHSPVLEVDGNAIPNSVRQLAT